MTDEPQRAAPAKQAQRAGPAVPVGGGVPVDPETGERFGYLPRKAANRKILIRSQLGLPWILWALAFGGAIVLAGVTYLLLRPSTPGPPFVDRGPLAQYADGEVTALPDGSGWVDRRTGLVVIGDPVTFCPADGGWVDAETARYDAAGRRVGGGDGLLLLPVRAASQRLFVDPTGGGRPTAAAASLGGCPNPQRLTDARPPDGL